MSGAKVEKEDSHTSEAMLSTPAPVKKFSKKKEEGLWLMSFSDMSMILISFFVLQLANSSPNKPKAEIMKESIQKNVAPVKQDNLTTVSKRIENEIKRLKLDKNAEVKIEPTGVMVEFKDGLLFSVGSADSNPQFTNVIGQVMKVIASAPSKYAIKVEGHTDDVPIRGTKFPSNWELSAARAISLMWQFQAKGVKENRLSVQAYAHTKPKVPTLGLSGQKLEYARAANRRVVIRIEAIE